MKFHLKKIICTVLATAMMATAVMPTISAYADSKDTTQKGYLALGADLTSEEKATVFSELGLTEDAMNAYDVVYITNAEEHQYLDAYIDNSRIGSTALSSVLVTKAEEGSGINVTRSKYITYCTTGMYENALATAGVTDVDVKVAGPYNVSGTAALVGVIKAYSQMTGETVDEEVVDAAVNEIVTTGELEDSIDADDESVEGLVAYLKEQVANGNIDPSNIDSATIDEAAKQFNITLTDEQMKQLQALLEKLGSMNLDLDTIAQQAQGIYDKLGDMGIKIDLSQFDVSKIDTEQAKGFLQQIIDFITGLFGK